MTTGRRRVTAASIATLVLAAAAATAHAQQLEPPRPRQGYYVAVGAHSQLTYLNNEGDGLGPWPGWRGTLRFGQLLTRRLGLGLQLDFGGTSGDESSASFFGLGFTGQFEVACNLAVHAGVGLGVVSLTEPDEDDLQGGFGAAYTVALTYDWFPRKMRTGGLALTPRLEVRALPTDSVDAYGAFLGVEITYWTGLPNNQLILPDSEAYRRAP